MTLRIARSFIATACLVAIVVCAADLNRAQLLIPAVLALAFAIRDIRLSSPLDVDRPASERLAAALREFENLVPAKQSLDRAEEQPLWSTGRNERITVHADAGFVSHATDAELRGAVAIALGAGRTRPQTFSALNAVWIIPLGWVAIFFVGQLFPASSLRTHNWLIFLGFWASVVVTGWWIWSVASAVFSRPSRRMLAAHADLSAVHMAGGRPDVLAALNAMAEWRNSRRDALPLRVATLITTPVRRDPGYTRRAKQMLSTEGEQSEVDAKQLGKRQRAALTWIFVIGLLIAGAVTFGDAVLIIPIVFASASLIQQLCWSAVPDLAETKRLDAAMIRAVSNDEAAVHVSTAPRLPIIASIVQKNAVVVGNTDFVRQADESTLDGVAALQHAEIRGGAASTPGTPSAAVFLVAVAALAWFFAGALGMPRHANPAVMLLNLVCTVLASLIVALWLRSIVIAGATHLRSRLSVFERVDEEAVRIAGSRERVIAALATMDAWRIESDRGWPFARRALARITSPVPAKAWYAERMRALAAAGQTRVAFDDRDGGAVLPNA